WRNSSRRGEARGTTGLNASEGMAVVYPFGQRAPWLRVIFSANGSREESGKMRLEFLAVGSACEGSDFSGELPGASERNRIFRVQRRTAPQHAPLGSTPWPVWTAPRAALVP